MQFLTGTSQTSAGGGGMFGGADGAELYAATASAPDHYFCQRMLYAMQFDSVAAAGADIIVITLQLYLLQPYDTSKVKGD
ncbi:hypothetical protein ACI65C_007301 [Semiaphis heraclei]